MRGRKQVLSTEIKLPPRELTKSYLRSSPPGILAGAVHIYIRALIYVKSSAIRKRHSLLNAAAVRFCYKMPDEFRAPLGISSHPDKTEIGAVLGDPLPCRRPICHRRHPRARAPSAEPAQQIPRAREPINDSTLQSRC